LNFPRRKRMKISTLTKQAVIAIMIVILALAAFPAQPAHAAACSWDGSSSTAWTTGSNWTGCTGGGGVPANIDTITIPSGTPNQPTLGGPATIAGLTVNAGATLTLGNQQLTVNGPVSNAGTITASTGRLMQQVSGDFTNTGTVTFTGNGRIYFAGNVSNSGTLTLGSAEVRFYGAGAGPFTVAGFTTTGDIDWRRTGGTVTFAGNVSAAQLLMDNGGGEAGTLILGAGYTFTFPTVATISGVAFTNNGTLTVSTALSGTGLLTNSSSGTLNRTGGSSSITSLANAGIVNISGAATSSTAVANFTNTGTVNLNTTGTITGITNNAAGTVNLTNSGTITSFNNATATSTLNISDLTPPTITTLTVTAVGNTVNYSGPGAQTVRATAFRTLILSGSGAKTLPVGTSTTGNLRIMGTATATPTGTAITVNSLTLGTLGAGPASSTWGSLASAATNRTDTYFTTGTAGYLTITNDTRAAQSTLTITSPASMTFGDADATITTSGGSGTGAVTFNAGASTACSIVAGKLHVVSGTGTCNITATKAADGNYLSATSASFAVTISKANQAALTITAPASMTFGDADATITTSGGSGSGAVSFDAGASTACSIVAGNLHVLSGTGTCDITATKAADNDYNSTTSASFAVTINKANQAALSITAPASMTFGDADATIFTSGGTTSGTVTFNAGASTACSIVAGKLHILSGTGSCDITATMAGDADYNDVTSASFPVTINKANQATLTITAPASATFGDADATISTSGGTTGGSVTFNAGASTACSIVAGKLHVLSGTGTCAITATMAGDADYNDVTSASFPVTINKANQAALTITAPTSMTFGDADATITTTGGTTGGSVTFNAGASTACSIVAGKLHVVSGTGSCDITATMAGNTDYYDVTSASFPVTINKANQAALTITAPASATFGDADATITTSGGSGSGAVTFDAGASTACSIVAGKLHVVSGTGTCDITATKATDNDYNATTSASFPVTINKANQAALSITAPASATFGDPDAIITTSGGSGSGAVTFDAGASTACSIVASKLHVLSVTGTCDITATKAADNDYNATTSASFPVTINKANQAALSITAPASMTFGDADAVITYTGGTTGGSVTFDAGASTACSIVAGKLHVVSGTGTCAITATMAGDADYNDVTSASFPVTINKANQATLTITAPASATFGDADATITTSGGSGSGAVSFDAGASTACSIVAGKLHIVSGTGTCDITATKAADNDYNATTSASFPVTINKADQATLTITGPAAISFGDPDATITTSGGSGSGAISFDSGASTACSIVAGKLHVISGTGTCDITATKAGDNDYNPTTSDPFTVGINKLTQATLTVTGPASITFGDADAVITYTGGSGSGAVSFSAGSSTACSIVSDKLHILSATGTCDITVHKAADADYAAATSDPFSVTLNKANQAALMITAPASMTYGDADATIVTSGGSGSGAISFDAGASTGCSIVSGKLHAISVAGTCDITATKAADNDYNATTSASFPVTINAKGLTVTADNQNINVGDPDPTFTFATVGFVAPDDFLTAPTCSVAGAHAAAGNYDITCSGADAGTNYSISYVKGTLTVTAVNNPPTDVSLSPASVNENQPVGTTVGALTTTDPDLTDTHTYAFCGGTDDASFQISGSNLQTNAVFDFETKSSYSICVRTDDGNGGAFDKTLAVTVNNLSETFTVTFKPNGGSGTMSPQTAGAPTALTLNAFTRAGYSFNGWNTTATGSGTAYTDGAVYSFAANLTLYAQWRPNPSANLLKSATFSAPTVFPYTWKVLGAQPSYASLLDCNIARSQPCSVRLTGGKGVDITILQMVKLAGKAGDTFSFGITNRANGVPATGGNFRVEVLFYKSWNTVIETSVIDLPTGTHDWRVYRGTVTAPADYTHIVFRFIYNKTRGSTWFDNAFLRKLP
jgi:uncharacterized repeat protein (TIGR02543 family)